MSNPLASAPLINKNGEIVSSKVLERKVVALYFSAYWCPPCRCFVPLLCRFYDILKANGENIEIVAVPGDDREDDFKNYFQRDHGDWLAIMPGSRECSQLNKAYLYGIPALLVLDCNGNVVVSDAKTDVAQAESDRSVLETFASWKKQAGLWLSNSGSTASMRRRLPDPFFGDPLQMQRSPSGQLGQVAPLASNLTDAIPRTKILPRRLPEHPSALPGSPQIPYTSVSPHGSRGPSCERAYFGIQDPNLISAVSYPYVLAPPLLPSSYEAPPPVPPVPPALRDRLDALEQHMTLQWEQRNRQKQPRVELGAASDERRRLEGLERQYQNILLENQTLQREVESIKLKQRLCEPPQNGKASYSDHNDLHPGLSRERDQLQSRHEEVLRENGRLQKELESIRNEQNESCQNGKTPNLESDLHLTLLRERDQLQIRHEEVLRENSRLQADLQKLQLDHSAEQRARSSISRKHEEVNKDTLQLKDDLQQLQKAHEAELQSTRDDYQQKHSKAQEAAANVWRDFQQMQIDRDAEQRLRKEAEEKSDAMFQDALRLRSDFERVEAALRAEQQAREELQLRHNDLDQEHKKVCEDLLDWQRRLTQSLENNKEELAVKNNEIEALIAKVWHLENAHDEANARQLKKMEDDINRLKNLERERDRALNDVQLLRKANEERELEIKALRSSPRLPRLSVPLPSGASGNWQDGSRRSSAMSNQSEIYEMNKRRASAESLQYEIKPAGVHWGSSALPDAPTDLGGGFTIGKKATKPAIGGKARIRDLRDSVSYNGKVVQLLEELAPNKWRVQCTDDTKEPLHVMVENLEFFEVEVNISDASSEDDPQMMVDLTGSDEDTAKVLSSRRR